MKSLNLLHCLLTALIVHTAYASAQTTQNQSSAEKTKLMVQDHVTNLAKAIESAKSKLQQATGSTEARQAQFDEMIGTIQKAIVEVSEGGETFAVLSTAIQQSETKMKDYKNKMSDPNTSVKTQEVYQRLAEKFKRSSEELYRSKMSLNTRRSELDDALKMAQEQKTLFIDMIQADELLEANEAVKKLAEAMSKVSNSINDMASEMGAEKPAAPVLR
jgi:chromosome segregation ATPase